MFACIKFLIYPIPGWLVDWDLQKTLTPLRIKEEILLEQSLGEYCARRVPLDSQFLLKNDTMLDTNHLSVVVGSSLDCVILFFQIGWTVRTTC